MKNGLLFSHAPTFASDSARSIKPFNWSKSSDSYYVIESEWCTKNFNEYMHPFSASVSGVMLCLLRALNNLMTNHNLFIFDSDEELKNFIRCFISLMIFQTGGHTIHEALYPFSIEEVKKAFPDFNLKDISEANIFLLNNEEAFNNALIDTFIYNEHLTKKESLNKQLTEHQSILKKM